MAVLVSVVSSGTPAEIVTTTLIGGASEPAATVGRVQRGWFPPVQVQPGPPAETIVIPDGSVSETSTSSASDGPSLVTTTSKEAFSPASTVLAPTTVLSTLISAASTTSVGSVATLLRRFGSCSSDGPLTVARLTSVAGPASGATSAVIVSGGASVFGARASA